MKKHIYFTGIWMAVVLLAMIVACNPPKEKDTEPIAKPLSELAAIDSLMWQQPDSAFTRLQEFVVSPVAKDLDEFNMHYCQLLISELLYKNDCEQKNREDLLRAVGYFDSIDDGFLAARAHYINGVGFYEKGDVVNACAEYLKTLEMMEAHFEEKELVGHKARFLAYTYNRLGDLFSEQFMMESAITCYENALVYCKIEPTSPIGVSNILYRIGKQYDKKNEVEIAQSYFSEALENMGVTDNMVYRDIVASKALCDYQINGTAKQSLDELNRILFQAKTENERLNRYLTIGGIFFYEDNYDSALYYLEPVFENREAGLQDQAANYLYVVYEKLGNKEQLDSLVHFMTSRKKLVGENKALVSSLEDMFKNFSNQKLKRQAKVEREKSVKRVTSIIIPTAVVVLLVVVCVLMLRNKKQLKIQQEEADRILGETEQAHEKELRLWQAEADKTLEETKKRYEEELEQLKADTEQQLEEVERKHQQWMAEAKERHTEELRMQKDKSEKEIEKTKKRHVKELEAERLAYEKEQDALRQNLKEREAQVIALEKTLNLQQKAAKQRRVAFLKEPICQHILNDARNQQITTRDVAHELGIALKDKDYEQLREAVERHYEGFDHELLSQCPSLKPGLLSLCHLHLLGLNESEIAALKNLSYSAIKKQNESLQEKLGVEESVAKYVVRVAEGLVGHAHDVLKLDLFSGSQGSSQKSSQKNSQKIVDLIKERPEITTTEMAEIICLTRRSIVNITNKLQEEGVIRRVGPDKGGHWEVIE
jgi:predicted transcriptional regulator